MLENIMVSKIMLFLMSECGV